MAEIQEVSIFFHSYLKNFSSPNAPTLYPSMKHTFMKH